MLRRVAVEMRSANKYHTSETAKKLAGPLCMTLACKYDIRSTFSIGQIASQFDPTILLSCDLSPENLTMAEFEIFRMLSFKIKDNSIILPDLLFESLSKVIFHPLLPSLPSQVADVALYLLFLTHLESEIFNKTATYLFEDTGLLVFSAIATAIKIIMGPRLGDLPSL